MLVLAYKLLRLCGKPPKLLGSWHKDAAARRVAYVVNGNMLIFRKYVLDNVAYAETELPFCQLSITIKQIVQCEIKRIFVLGVHN